MSAPFYNQPTPPYFKTMPVSENPTEDGTYFVIMVNPEEGEFMATEQWEDGKWHFNKSIVKWLKPVSELNKTEK